MKRPKLVHPRLTTHPLTGAPIVPVGYRRDGRPIMPILGGAPDDPPPDDSPPADPPPDDQLGDGGKKALDAERRAKRAAEKRAGELEARLKEIEDRDKSEADKLAERAEKAERRAQDLELRTLRLEVAAEKGLTASQAKRLVGTTREELEADATELLEDFKSTKTPKPDPTQGSGDKPPTSRLEEGRAEARKRFGTPAGQH